MAKYYLANLKIQCGEYEFYCTFKTKIEGRGKIENKMKKLAKTFYGDDGENTYKDDAYYFNCGDVAVSVSDYHEINQAMYNTLPRDVINELL